MKVVRPVCVVAPDMVSVPMLATAAKKFVELATVEKNDVDVALVKVEFVAKRFVEVAFVEVEKPEVR